MGMDCKLTTQDAEQKPQSVPDSLRATNRVIREVLDLVSSGTRTLLSEKEAGEGNRCGERSPSPALSLMEQSHPDSGARQ